MPCQACLDGCHLSFAPVPIVHRTGGRAASGTLAGDKPRRDSGRDTHDILVENWTTRPGWGGMGSGEIRTILWATGFRPDYSWLDIPVLDRKGFIRHESGVADSPGLYVLGLPFLRRRKSSFIHGIEDDARYMTGHMANFLNQA